MACERVTVALGDLKANPFKKFIQEGKLDRARIDDLKDKFETTSLWEQWVVRETKNGYELAFGHHRLQAAIELFGRTHTISAQLEEDYNDDKMFQSLANENHGREEPTEAKWDVVKLARKRLLEDPGRCRWTGAPPSGGPVAKHGRTGGGAAEQHKHGSPECISAYLSAQGKVWSVSTIEELSQLDDKLDASLKSAIATTGTTHPARQQQLSRKAALALTQLDKPVQRAVAGVLKDDTEVGLREVKKIVEAAKGKTVAQAKKIAEEVIADSEPVVLLPKDRSQTKQKDFAKFIEETAMAGRRFSKSLDEIVKLKEVFDNKIYRHTLGRSYLESVCKGILKKYEALFAKENEHGRETPKLGY